MSAGDTKAILDELKAIRQLLEHLPAVPAPRTRPAADERVKMPVAPAHAMGREDAPVTLVEFTDVECPFCRQFHLTTFAELKENYVDTGKVRFVSRDLPLDVHRNALKAAHASRCAGAQDKGFT